MGKLSKKIS